jgi:hypothetical protein
VRPPYEPQLVTDAIRDVVNAARIERGSRRAEAGGRRTGGEALDFCYGS